MAHGSACEATSDSASERRRKSVPEGLRNCPRKETTSFVQTSLRASETTWARHGRHRLHPHIYLLPEHLGGGGSGLTVAHCSDRVRGTRFRAILAGHAVHHDIYLLRSNSAGSACAREGHQNYFESPSGALMRQQGVPGGSREAQGCLGGSPVGTLRTKNCRNLRDEGV